MAPSIEHLGLYSEDSWIGRWGHVSRLLGMPTPQLRRLTYRVLGDDTSIVRGLAKLSQLRSLDLALNWRAWKECEVEDMQCMAGLQSLEVGIGPF